MIIMEDPTSKLLVKAIQKLIEKIFVKKKNKTTKK